MDFGKTDDIDGVDFTLPQDKWQTLQLFKELKNKPAKKINIHVGCAKWGRKDWIGQVYPIGTKDKDFFSVYAGNFNSIELNATHYRIPTTKTVLDWKSKVAPDFKFCPKFPQIISHMKRLKNADETTQSFYEAIRLFENTLGTVFLQMPPNFGPKNYGDLEKYIESLPTDIQVCVEFRHHAWFGNDPIAEQTWQMLKEKKIGTVITDAAGEREVVHQILTTPEAFIRFVGNSLHPTDYSRIDTWVAKIKDWLDNGLETLYFFMHQHEEQYSPVLCAYFIRELNKKCGLRVKEPHLLSNQKTFFD